MRYRSSVAMYAAAICIPLLGGCPSAWAGDPDPQGRQLYRQYCSACHGPDGRGDGVASSLMRPHPPDLTRLAAANGGRFPMETVMTTIDGRAMPRAHGDPAMPVWGRILREELGDGHTQQLGLERRVHDRIFTIADYLRSIQVAAK